MTVANWHETGKKHDQWKVTMGLAGRYFNRETLTANCGPNTVSVSRLGGCWSTIQFKTELLGCLLDASQYTVSEFLIGLLDNCLAIFSTSFSHVMAS